MISMLLPECLAQVTSRLLDVGEIDRPVGVTGGSNGQEACARVGGIGNIGGRVEKLSLDCFVQHLVELGLMKRRLSFLDLTDSL